MKKHARTLSAFVLLFVAAFGFSVLAAPPRMEEGYKTRAKADAPVQIRNGTLDGDDSADWTTPISTSGVTQSVFDTGGNPSIAVSTRFSLSGATSQVTVGLYHRVGSVYTFQSIAGIWTGTGGNDVDQNSEYPGNTLVFDSQGANAYEVRIKDPSEGTVRLWAWSYGTHSVGAGQ